MGVLFLYSRYSSPSRFASSGSSIAFNSQTFKPIKRGVNMKVKLKDRINIPKPNRSMNTPESIGFLAWPYGPVSTNLGGGLKGTGVPFSLRKCRTDHPVKDSPKKSIGKDKIILNGLEKSWDSSNNLSNCKAKRTNSVINKAKKTAPTGVRRFRTFLLPVAIL